MRILHFVLILAVSMLLKNVYCDSSNPLPNAPLSSLPKTKASPKQFFSRKNIRWEGQDEFFFFLTHEISNKYTNGLRPRGARTLSDPLMARSPPPPPQVTSYILAVQWPPGVCNVNTDVTCLIDPVPTEFTIHSLWPQPNGAPSTETFDDKKIATLTSELNKNWPNLMSKQQSIVFWQQEWESRGKYSGLGVLAYFQRTLDLFKNAGQGLRAKLAAENITPNINTYKLVAIQAAIKKINGGFSGTIICSGINKQQIQEIQFRYTNGFQKQDNSNPSNCGPDILFPPQVTSYTLAVQWPPGVCTGNSGFTCNIKPVPAEFTIHGLWPNPNGAPPIETFDGTQIATITSDLNKYWPNLKSTQQSVSVNLKFWQDEWIKHGKYSDLGVLAYFKKTLDLFKNTGQVLKTKLAAERITPTNIKTYKLVDIQNAVKKINGVSGTVRCVTSKVGNVQQIQEIRFRYKKNFDKQDNSESSNCGTDVRFPA